MEPGLKGRTAVATGTSKGIGRVIAGGLAAEGSDLHGMVITVDGGHNAGGGASNR